MQNPFIGQTRHFGLRALQCVAPKSISAWLKSNTCWCGSSAADSAHSRFFIAWLFGSPLPMKTRNSTRATLVSRMAARSRKAKLRIAPAVYSPMPLNDSSVVVVGRQLAVVLRDRLLRDRLQALRPDVVAERVPRPGDLRGRRLGQHRERRILAEPLVILRQHAIDLRLLQHDLGDEDVVRVVGVAPRQVAAVLAIPRQQVAAKALPQRRCRERMCSSSVRQGMGVRRAKPPIILP